MYILSTLHRLARESNSDRLAGGNTSDDSSLHIYTVRLSAVPSAKPVPGWFACRTISLLIYYLQSRPAATMKGASDINISKTVFFKSRYPF